MQSAMPSTRKPFVTIGYDEEPLEKRAQPVIIPSVQTCTDGPDTPPEVTVTETRPGFRNDGGDR